MATPSLAVVRLRNRTMRIGVMIRVPATTLEKSGMRMPCR